MRALSSTIVRQIHTFTVKTLPATDTLGRRHVVLDTTTGKRTVIGFDYTASAHFSEARAVYDVARRKYPEAQFAPGDVYGAGKTSPAVALYTLVIQDRD